MLVALIMFALISVGTSFLISGALRGQYQLGTRAAEAQEARALLHILTRDLRNAFAVSGSPTTYFVATGTDSGAVLQFTTLASRLMPDLAQMTEVEAADSLLPQSDVLQVTYDYDPATHVLSRLVSNLPGVDTLPETGQPEYIISRRVALLAFTFVDSSGNTRNDWNLQTPQTAEGSQPTDATSYDTTLPSQVIVELELDRPNGETVYLTTTVVPANATIQPAGQKPPAPAATLGAGGGTGGGAGGGGGTGGGSGGGGTP